MTTIFDKLQKLNIKNPEIYTKAFKQLISEVKKDSYKITLKEIKKQNYSIITEENRMQSYFLHIVPNEAKELFQEIQKKAPNQLLGYTVFIKKYKNKDVRVSCFGIDCSKLAKALIK